MKRILLFLFILILIGYSLIPVLAQKEGDPAYSGTKNEGQNPYFKAFFGLYRGFWGFSGIMWALGSNIWDFKLKPYLAKISEALPEKGIKDQVPGIERELNKEIKELKEEIKTLLDLK